VAEEKIDKEVLEEYARKAVLVADDILFHRTVLTLLLNKLGFNNIRHASDGMEALNSAEEFEFDYIFMDIFMPKLNGIEVAKRIRAMPKFKDVPIIGVTASTLSEEQIAEAQATFAYILMKPVHIQHLEWIFERICGCEFKRPAVAFRPNTPLRILVVDDQASMRRILGFTLSQVAGGEVQSCGSGAEALGILKSAQFDVVIVDRVMPDMDGFDTARQIIASYSTPPAIILMSSDFSNYDIATSKDIGVDGILEKPIKLNDFESLWERVKVNRGYTISRTK
jgi:CheY-like chemotaxis protein